MATLNQVRHDHANMARLLHVLLLRHESLTHGERPDFHLIREVVDYILDYMNSFVGPLERLYSEHHVAKKFKEGEAGQQLAEDYQALRERLNLLSENIDMILLDAVVPMDRFADDLKAYLDAHLAYLRAERELLFPFFREKLTKEEQKNLLKMLPEGAQANLARLKEDYPELYDEFKSAPSPFA
ncbi:hemerythrin domain-containing protein [Marinobacter sp.]|uniref:hemerythrin domain-containing protein n=1 Tax=Marinobacter sp. TaxID=50741 RepID=UPI003A94DED0